MNWFWWTQPKHPVNDLKNQKSFYSGKKKRHTLKAQIITDHLSHKIISVHTSAGSVHDFKLFKQSIRKMHSQTVCFADSGYQGLANRHTRGYTPKKRSWPDSKVADTMGPTPGTL